jgi:hypothetical protein
MPNRSINRPTKRPTAQGSNDVERLNARRNGELFFGCHHGIEPRTKGDILICVIPSGTATRFLVVSSPLTRSLPAGILRRTACLFPSRHLDIRHAVGPLRRLANRPESCDRAIIISFSCAFTLPSSDWHQRRATFPPLRFSGESASNRCSDICSPAPHRNTVLSGLKIFREKLRRPHPSKPQ